MNKQEWHVIRCGWGDTKARLQYIHAGVYYWTSDKGFKFLTHDLKDAVKI